MLVQYLLPYQISVKQSALPLPYQTAQQTGSKLGKPNQPTLHDWSKNINFRNSTMAFTFAAFSYIVALIIDAFLLFFAIFHVSIIIIMIEIEIQTLSPIQIIAFDELKTDYKNPIDQCASLNPLVLPEYLLHILFNILFLFAGEWFSLMLNVPLIAYHVHR